MSDLTFFAEEPLASHSVSLGSEPDWMILVATSFLPWVPFRQSIGPNVLYGRTSPESCRGISDETLQSFWDSSRARKSSPPPKAGKAAASSSASNLPTAWPTACLTLNTSEWPSDAAVCSLSDVLEIGEVPRRFFLSATACQGILRRAGKRGKSLPPQLSAALESVADTALMTSV